MREEQRQLIRGVAAGELRAARAFVDEWDSRFRYWVSQQAPPYKVEEYTQEVWVHLMRGNWLRLLQWRPLYEDDAWHEHSLEGYLKRITRNKVKDLLVADAPGLPPGLDPNDIIDGTTPVGWDPAVGAERARLIEAFEFCARAFKEQDHLALNLWWQGYDARYIAEQVGSNPNNVYQRRSYLLNRLRECLVERLPGYFRRV